jgi:hypothetical protein
MDDLGRVAMRAMVTGIQARALVRLGRLSETADIAGDVPPDARTEIRLARGDYEGALERLDRAIVRSSESADRRAAMIAGEAKVRALAGLSRDADAEAEAGVWLERARASDFRPIAWRLYASRARARKALGNVSGAEDDHAAAVALLREMAAGIADEADRQRFLSGPDVVSLAGTEVGA